MEPPILHPPPPQKEITIFLWLLFCLPFVKYFLMFLFVRYLHTVELRCISALQMATEKVPEAIKCNK